MRTESEASASRATLRIRVVSDTGSMRELEEFGDYALAEVAAEDAGGEWSVGERLVIPLSATTAGEWLVDPAHCLRLPAHTRDSAALLLPPTIAALEVWSTLGLELGEAALVCGSTRLAALLGRAAQWHGARPVIALGTGMGAVSGIATVDAADSERAIAQIRELVGANPGFAAVDLSGQSNCADILLQALPRWGRLRLAGACSEPLIVDFYKDVHLKGARIFAVPFTAAAVFMNPTVQPLLTRAARLLSRREIHAELSTLFEL